MSKRWIVIPGWDKFQHRDVARGDTVPAWIKDYTDQLSREEYRMLTFAERGLLQALRQEYARTRRALTDDTASLSRRLGQRVLSTQLERLNHAGFIEFSASSPLAACQQPASLEVEEERSRAFRARAREAPVEDDTKSPPDFSEKQLLRVMP